MILKLNTGIACNGVAFEPGDVVNWKDDGDCKRLIAKGVAVQASAAEVKAAEGKVKSYTPPRPRPEDKWPPSRLKVLKSEAD